MFFCLFICNCGLLCTYEFKYYEVVKSDSIIEKLKKGTFSFDGKVITLASPSYGAYTKFATETANLAITVAKSPFFLPKYVF